MNSIPLSFGEERVGSITISDEAIDRLNKRTETQIRCEHIPDGFNLEFSFMPGKGIQEFFLSYKPVKRR
jgi:hypothetical protein